MRKEYQKPTISVHFMAVECQGLQETSDPEFIGGAKDFELEYYNFADDEEATNDFES